MCYRVKRNTVGVYRVIKIGEGNGQEKRGYDLG